jgi:hypothetical protein
LIYKQILEEILMGGPGLFLFKEGSRNSINNKRREEHFSANYQHYFALRLPHQDTVADVLCKLDSSRCHRSSQF